jgi:hypothetical protein
MRRREGGARGGDFGVSKSPKRVAWPAEKVERRKLSELTPYAKNSNLHSPEQIADLVKLIQTFGWTMPILVDPKGGIIAGHARVLAGEKLKLKEVPVVVARNWSAAMKRAYVIADNQIGRRSRTDVEVLREEIAALRLDNFDVGLLAFEGPELAAFGLDFKLGEFDANAHWTGMPEFDQQDKTAFRSVIVHFKDQAGVDAFAKKLKRKITDKTKFLWFPEIEVESYVDKRYKANGGAKAAAEPAE